jgi:hypothetical protein
MSHHYSPYFLSILAVALVDYTEHFRCVPRLFHNLSSKLRIPSETELYIEQRKISNENINFQLFIDFIRRFKKNILYWILNNTKSKGRAFMEEKRRFLRVDLTVPVNYEIDNKAKLKNVSEGGLCIITEKPLSYGFDLTIMFSLPEAIPLGIKSFAKVVWSKLSGNNMYESGIQFWDINPVYVKRLQTYIKKHADPIQV